MGDERQHNPPGEVLGHVLACFRDVRLEHDEDDALRKFLLINEEIAQAGHGAGPQDHPDHSCHDPGLVGEHQHRREPDAAHYERLTKAREPGDAGQLNQ